MAARVTRISIAPVKSLGLVHPDEVELEPHGVRGNRRFWLVDEDGRLFNNKRDGPMVRIRPEWDEETRRLALTFPDGARVEGTVELGEAVDAEMYGHPHPSRRVLGPWEDAISRVRRPAAHAALGRAARGRPRLSRRHRLARLARFARAAAARKRAPPSRSTAGVSGCSSRSTESARTKKTNGSARRCASVTRRSS